ncbi:MAG: DNA translocase FtsK 4TM domain-containing protein [Bacteroidales bacterium]|nr:DNA translocase FtsK 4TM domain-containing protein [Bacteroidales bacterium]
MAKKEKTKLTKTTKEERLKAKAETQVPKRKDAFYLICGLVALAVSAFTFFSLFSYVFSWAEDQSVFYNKDMFDASVEVQNNGGKLGLMWANFLVSRLFGLGAFIVPFFFLGVGLYCLKLKQIKLLRFFILSLLGCIVISLAFSFIFSFTRVDDWFGGGAGGSYGYFVILWLKNMIGPLGAGSIVFILLVVWMILVNGKIITGFYNWADRVTAPKPKKVIEEEAVQEVAEEETAPVGNLYADLDAEIPATCEEEDEKDLAPAFEIIGGEVDDSGSSAGEEAEENLSGKGEENKGEELSLPDNDTREVEVLSTPDDMPVTQEEAAEEEILGDDNLFDPRLDLSSYQAPPLTLLEDYKDKWYVVTREELEKNNRQIVRTLANYKIGVTKISARVGPTVTLYEIVPAPGVRVAQIKRLEEDIQLSLAAKGVRVVTLPGTNAIGIEVANEKPSTVSMLSVLDDEKFKSQTYDLPVALGMTITNDVMHFDLAKMPHLLVAGATGQGKSVGLNAILTSLLYYKHPSELKLVLVDPKKVELSLYSKLEKHFLAQLPDADEPVITDTQKVVYTLKSLCIEMDARYDLLKLAYVRNIKEYNEKFLQRKLNPLKGHRFLPYIVVVIDEFADLLMTAGKEIEEPIARLAQLARAIGIHLVIATQRPTTSVITGNIKANFPARIAFMVRSSVDSRTILDQTGANQLIGRGDMLISNGGDLTRVQCAFIDTKEVERVVDYISAQRGYTTAHYLPEYTGEDKEDDGGVGEVDLNRRDSLFEDAAKLVVMHQQGSTSLIQRKMNLGYNRAGRIMDQLEAAGIVGPYEGSKARQVLVGDLSELDARLANIKDIYG